MSGTTLRQMAGNPVAAGGGNPAVHSEGGGGGDENEDVPEGMDLKKLYNQNRMLSRILKKREQDLQSLTAEIEPLKGVRKQFDSFKSLFSGEGEGAGNEGEVQPTAYQRALAAHERARAADPDAAGIPLTVGIAQEASEGFRLAKEQAGVIQQLQERLKVYETPMYHAEQQAFLTLATKLESAVTDLFGDDTSAMQNYEGFEKSAIAAIQAMKKDPKTMKNWRNILINERAMDEFVRSVIQTRMPRAWAPRGAAPVDEYDVGHAKADAVRAAAMKPGRERQLLQEKSRRRLLEETFASQIDLARFNR